MKEIKKDIIYLKKKVLFTRKEVEECFSSKESSRIWIQNEIKNNNIIRIRNGLYSVVDPTTGNVYASKYLIGSTINSSSYISYHSALDYYGLTNQNYNVVYISSNTMFKNFTFSKIDYKFIKSISNIEINKIDYGATLKVTSLERTIIDCIRNLRLGGGIEEVLNSLSLIKSLNEDKLLFVLKIYNDNLLYSKVCYLLEVFNNNYHLSKSFFLECKKHLNTYQSYFLKEMNFKLELNKWNLYAPSKIDLLKIINGGL